MDLIAELHDLQKKAVLFSTETDRHKRWDMGRWLERKCDDLNGRHRILDGFNEEAKVELSAIITIIFDYLLYDCLEDEDWALALPDHYDGDMQTVIEGMRVAANAS